MSKEIECPDTLERHHFAGEVFEREYDAASALLGPDGEPLKYRQRPRLGFDLRPVARCKA